MRKLPSLRAGVAVAMTEFGTHLSPPDPTTKHPAPQPSPAVAKCEARSCPWWPYTSSKDLKANTALIIIILFCALICTLAFNAVVRYIIRTYCIRRRSRNAENPKAELGGAAAEEQEAEIPTQIYTEGMKLTGAEAECTICLSEFTAGERIRVLERCNHGFHVRCIQQWLVSRSSCPTCRTNCALLSNAPPQ